MIKDSLKTAATSFIADTEMGKDLKKRINKLYLDIKLNEKKVNETLFDYLQYIHKQCYQINTIFNPNIKISLDEIYELIEMRQLSSSVHNVKSSMPPYINVNDYLNGYIDNNIIITDSAGMGKTTFTKYLVLALIKKERVTKFPLFIELRKMKNNQTIKEYCVEQINSVSSNKISEDTFNHMFSLNIFLFILDGFDEIDISNKPFLSTEIDRFSNNYFNNTIVLTTRKQENIPNVEQKTIYEFKPLKKRNIINILTKLDKVYNNKIGEELIRHTNFNSLDFSLFETPLMVNLLYIYYSYTHSVDNNITNFYNELFNALYKGHDSTKDGFERIKKSNLGILDFKKLFCAFSFISVYNNNIFYESEEKILYAIRLSSKISGVELTREEDFLVDILINIPLIVKEGIEYKFIHKTIAEYFSAEYINLPEHTSKIFAKIKSLKKESQFKKSFEFLYEINYNLFLKEIGIPFLNDYKKEYKKNREEPFLTLFKHLYSDFLFVTLKNIPEKSKLERILEDTKWGNEVICTPKENYIEVSVFPKVNNYYEYLPLKFLKSLTTIYNCNNSFLEFEPNKEYNLNSEIFLINTQNKDFREKLYNKISKEILFKNNEVIDISKVNTLLQKEIKMKDNFDDLI